MSSKLESTQLYKYLLKKDARLAERAKFVRDEQQKWLPLIRASFPHYPDHGVEHSERIAGQLSRMLFDNSKPVVKFSGAEEYCLICAAYLHDMGMVVSSADTELILKSDAWKKYVSANGAGHASFVEYQKLQQGVSVADQTHRGFLAAQALRFLIADFVRRSHHERGKTALELHPYLKQLVSENDSVAFETIADIGVGHGLREDELADESRFPQERDVFGEKVDVRFLTRLLRIGDLLDMDTERADPMTALGVAELPTDARPHWRQYAAKTHENISPKEIGFRFECKDQEVHRVLRDWFGWLETEVRNASIDQRHARRHHDWKGPRCVVASQADFLTPDRGVIATIFIKPAKDATYTFHDWKLELDPDAVFHRLIHDVYENPSTFVRELLQNALDATRCQMYRDFELNRLETPLPAQPTQFSSSIRERYPIALWIDDNEPQSNGRAIAPKQAILTIEDRGTGMTEEVIRRYFLQVGRSYYQSREFREQYRFAPTSRFGVGFLSVFAVSKDITVETQGASSRGIRVRLSGPKNYLLTERWEGFTDRPEGSRHGTRIRLVLDPEQVFQGRPLLRNHLKSPIVA